jgi:hypothetical protein
MIDGRELATSREMLREDAEVPAQYRGLWCKVRAKGAEIIYGHCRGSRFTNPTMIEVEARQLKVSHGNGEEPEFCTPEVLVRTNSGDHLVQSKCPGDYVYPALLDQRWKLLKNGYLSVITPESQR